MAKSASAIVGSVLTRSPGASGPLIVGLDRRDGRTVWSHGVPAVAQLVQLLFGRLPGRLLSGGGVVRGLRSRRHAAVARYDVQLAVGLRDVPAEADRDTPFLSLQPDVADDEPATREVGDGALHRGRVLRRQLLLRLIRGGRGPRAEGERDGREP